MVEIFKPDAELFRWGPTPMKVFYMSEFIKCIFEEFPKYYDGHTWSKVLLIVYEGRFIWINDKKELEESGGAVFLNYMLKRDFRSKVEKLYEIDLESVRQFQKKIEEIVLSTLSDKEFTCLWSEFERTVIQFWVHGTVPELANYGSIPILKDALSKHIKNDKELNDALEILSAPEELSFYQEEELDLLETNDVETHQQKYFWLRNSYDSTEVLDEVFFVERKKELSSTMKKETQSYLEEVQERKDRLIKRYSLPGEVVNIGEAISYGVAWQDRRKKDILIYLHYKDLLLNELVRRYNLQKRDTLHYMTHELTGFLQKGTVKECIGETNNRAWIFEWGSALQYEGNDAASLWKEYALEKIEKKLTEFSGTVASQAKTVTEKVRIVTDPKDTEDFEDGDILVTSMTAPEYIFLMKKASAIVTDTGGLTSHAAIVSRELKKPCIVGTKVATQVLKDGDLVEVDANTGIVKIIERYED